MSATATNGVTWLNGTSALCDMTGHVWTVRVTTPPAGLETPEARQAREAAVARWRQQQEAQQAELAEATQRAERLLVEHLAPEQRAAYERDQFFEVVAALARYRIYHDGGVRRLGEDGREVASYCIHPIGALPSGDLALAKKLLLETDEVAFLRIANATVLVLPQASVVGQRGGV